MAYLLISLFVTVGKDKDTEGAGHFLPDGPFNFAQGKPLPEPLRG